MKRVLSTLFVILVIAVIWVGAWMYGAGQINQAFEQAKADFAASGGVLDCESFSIDGLPFRYDVECLGLTIEQNDVLVHLSAIGGAVRVYRPTHAVIVAEGPLDITDQLWGSKRTLTWDSAVMSARTHGFALQRISLQANALRLVDSLLGERLIAEADELQAHIFDIPENHDAEQGLSVWGSFFSLIGVDLPELDITDGDARFEADVPGMPDDLRRLSLETVSTNWRDPINAINVHIAQLRDGRSEVEANGRFTLDEDNLWEGDVDLFTTGLKERLAQFIAEPMLDIWLGDPSQSGGLYRAYSIRHGVLFAGNIPVFVLPALY